MWLHGGAVPDRCVCNGCLQCRLPTVMGTLKMALIASDRGQTPPPTVTKMARITPDRAVRCNYSPKMPQSPQIAVRCNHRRDGVRVPGRLAASPRPLRQVTEDPQ